MKNNRLKKNLSGGISKFKTPESWGKKSILFDVTKSDALIGIKVETLKEVFTVPIIDVRRSFSERERANEQIKGNNIATGSKFFKPSFSEMGYSYNVSRKI